MRKKQVTILELATRLGLSPSTVSRALNGRHRISAETQKRVKTLASELGYRPNVSARHLRENRTYTLGLLLSGLDSRFLADFLEAVAREARLLQHHLILEFGQDLEVLDFLLDAQLDGVFVQEGPEMNRTAILERVRQRQVPLVLLGPQQDRPAWESTDDPRQTTTHTLACTALHKLFEEIDAMEHENHPSTEVVRVSLSN